MAKKATPVGEDQKDNPGVEEVTAEIPGVGPITTYFLVEYVDDLTGKTGEGTQTVKMRFPHEAENEVVDLDDQGEPLKNDDGTDKLTTEKFIGYEEMVLDLSDVSVAKLYKALEPFRKVARPAPAQPAAPIRTRTASTSGSSNPKLTEWNRRAREWAKELNIPGVADRGRLKPEIQDAYAKANPNDPRPSE